MDMEIVFKLILRFFSSIECGQINVKLIWSMT